MAGALTVLDNKQLRRAPEAVLAALARRGFSEVTLEELVAARDRVAAVRQQTDSLRQQRNACSKALAAVPAPARATSPLRADAERLAADLKQRTEAQRQAEQEWSALVLALPNMPLDDVPSAGAARVLWTRDASGAVQPQDWQPQRATSPRPHWQVAAQLGQEHSAQAVAMSGARFVGLSGGLARLSRALATFMLDEHTARGYREYLVPSLVLPEALVGSGQLPKFGDDLYRTQDGLYLSPTSEVQLVNLWRDQVLAEATLPQRLTAHTHCFRRESGSYGRDTRGFIRLHEFEKVEMVHICRADLATRANELDSMVAAASRVLTLLELPHRLLLLDATDMAVSASKTYDLEVWMPASGGWREISSLSDCGDYQARRANIRYKQEAGGSRQFVATLNGSGVAIGRCLAALLEWHWQETTDAQVRVRLPAALRPYMRGADWLVSG